MNVWMEVLCLGVLHFLCVFLKYALHGFRRARRALDHRKNMDEDRIAILEQMIKDADYATTESDRKFEEVRGHTHTHTLHFQNQTGL